jgi:hypothetical protein
MQNDMKTKGVFRSTKLDDPILIFMFCSDAPYLLVRGRDDNRIFFFQAFLKFTDPFQTLLAMMNMVVMLAYSVRVKNTKAINMI